MQKNSKNLKTSFRHFFYPNRDEIGQEREKKNLVPNFVPPRTGLENSKKKNSKKIKRIKKIILALFLSKLGRDRARKRKKKFSTEFRSYPTQAR